MGTPPRSDRLRAPSGWRIVTPPRVLAPVSVSLEEAERPRAKMELTPPLPFQHPRFVGRARRGDFGESIQWQIPAMAMATLPLAIAILLESTLSFLGVGVPFPAPTWGMIVAEGRNYASAAWWIVACPGLVMMVTALSIDLRGEWFRDPSDARSRRVL